MHALMLLNGLRMRAALRQRLRELLSLRGVLFVSTIVLFLVFINRSLSALPLVERIGSGAHTAAADSMLGFGLLVGIVISALTSSSGALQFSQAETNLLLASPLSRASIVINKCLSYGLGAALSAGLLAVLLPGLGISRPQLFLATLLSLVCVQTGSAALSMSGALLGSRLPVLPARKSLLIGFALGTAVLFIPLLRHAQDAGLASTLMSAFDRGVVRSGFARVLLSPFAAIAGLYLPNASMVDIAMRIAMAVLMIAGLIFVIVRLDRHLLDESSDASLAGDRRWRRMLTSGQVWRRDRTPLHSHRPVRYFGGAGALAWAQALRLLRTTAPTLFALPFLALLGGALLGASGSRELLMKAAPLLFFGAVFLLPKMLVFDFRGSFESIEKLQTLPLKPRQVALGQLATPVLVSSALWLALLLGATPFVPNHALLIVGALLALPCNTLIYAAENAGFLVAPSRPVPVGRMDFDFLGRTLVDFVIKCLALLTGFGIAGASAWLAWSASAGAIVPAIVAFVVSLLAVMALAVTAVAIAFRRFDTARAR